MTTPSPRHLPSDTHQAPVCVGLEQKKTRVSEKHKHTHILSVSGEHAHQGRMWPHSSIYLNWTTREGLRGWILLSPRDKKSSRPSVLLPLWNPSPLYNLTPGQAGTVWLERQRNWGPATPHPRPQPLIFKLLKPQDDVLHQSGKWGKQDAFHERGIQMRRKQSSRRQLVRGSGELTARTLTE